MLSVCQMMRASTARIELFLLHCTIGWKSSTNHSMQVKKQKNKNKKTLLQGTVIYLLTHFHSFRLDTSSQVARAAEQSCDPLLRCLAARLLTGWTALQPLEKDLL